MKNKEIVVLGERSLIGAVLEKIEKHLVIQYPLNSENLSPKMFFNIFKRKTPTTYIVAVSGLDEQQDFALAALKMLLPYCNPSRHKIIGVITPSLYERKNHSTPYQEDTVGDLEQQKARIEEKIRFLLSSYKNGLTLCLGHFWGSEESFLTSLIKRSLYLNEVEVSREIYSVTYWEHLVEVVEKIVEYDYVHSFNIAAKGECSDRMIIEKIGKVINKQIKIREIGDPRYTVLDNGRWDAVSMTTSPSIETLLEKQLPLLIKTFYAA